MPSKITEVSADRETEKQRTGSKSGTSRKTNAADKSAENEFEKSVAQAHDQYLDRLVLMESVN